MTALSGPLARHCHPTACFSVVAATEPGVMPRVLEVFAKRGLVPDKWLSHVAGHSGQELHIDIQLAGADAVLTDRLAQTLRQVVSVRSVLTSEKRHLRSA